MGTAVFAATYFGVSLALRKRTSQKTAGFGSIEPIDIVKERYARGEISRSEYERMRDDLTAPSDTKTREV